MESDSSYCQIDGCDGLLADSNEEDGETVTCPKCGAAYTKRVYVTYELFLHATPEEA